MPNSPILGLPLMTAAERKRAYGREWRARNQDRLRVYRKADWARADKGARAAANLLYRNSNRERVRENNRRAKLKQLYGLTPEMLDALKAEQHHACALCAKVKPLNVDHSHSTGKVRGLLCTPCNTSLGVFGHDPALLRAAADYVERNRK